MKLSPMFAVAALMTSTLSVALASPAAAENPSPIQIVSALYGKANATRPTNFTLRLQQTCGAYATDCQAFCTNAFVGRGDAIRLLPIGPTPICRVTYRCGAKETLVTDAGRNEMILLSCRDQ